MSSSLACFHHLEWPAPGARVRGPVLWLRGWVVGRSGHDIHDVRAVCGGQVHLGLLGLPRTDLAAHFHSLRAWLPAEFVLGVPVPDGPAQLFLEAQDALGAWHPLQTLTVTVAPDGETNSRDSGRLESQATGGWTYRSPHLPFHGHLDEPGGNSSLENGRVSIFGWLLHENQPIKAVWATTNLQLFQQLEHAVIDDALAARVRSLPQARQARLRGGVDLPPTLVPPVCLRIYAELADGSVHLCFAQRIALAPPPVPRPLASPLRPLFPTSTLSVLPSGRTRRLLLCTLNLQRDDSTLRALDIARHLILGLNWGVRLLTTADGPLRSEFESAGVSVQIVSPQEFFSASTPATAGAALATLGRQIWFRHLDAVAVFNTECLWAAQLGRQSGIPVLVDCSDEQPVTLAGASTLSGGLATTVVFSSETTAHSHAEDFAGAPSVLISAWHSEKLPDRESPESGPPHFLVAPIRGTAAQGAPQLLFAGSWLTQKHPEFAAQHRLAVSDVRGTTEEQLFVRDAVLNQPALMAIESIGLERACACVCPAFSNPPIRMLLDAAAMGLPVIASSTPALQELFPSSEVAFFPAGNPLALAHALVDHAANPAATRRRASAAQRRVLTRHAPVPLLRRWQAALESMVAAAR